LIDGARHWRGLAVKSWTTSQWMSRPAVSAFWTPPAVGM
jgi:hypothetical protein